MEEDVLNALRSQAAYLPGGYDRDARHLIVVPMPQELHPWTKTQLDTCFNYILNSLRDDNKSSGFTVVVDAQKSSWRVTRTHLRYVNTCLGEHLQDLLVIRPDTFWDTQHVVDNCAKSHKRGEPIILSQARLSKYFDAADLPVSLGGTIAYDHDRWLSNHIRFEEFQKLHERATNDLENLHLLLLDNKSIRADETEQALATCARLNGEVKASLDATLTNGNALITTVEEQHHQHQRLSPDIIDLAQNIRDLLKELETKQSNVALAWMELEKGIQTSRELSVLEEGVAFVTNWILGTAESLLNDQQKVGYDEATAEQLRKDHDALEMQCLETYGFYAELLHKIQILPIVKNSYSHADLMSQKQFMDFVCRSFATRLERRRNVLITSVRFFRLVSEYFDRTSEAFDTLILNNKLPEFDKAPGLLKKLTESAQSLDKLESELVKEGEKLSDMLAMPVKDALGGEVQLDYSEDIINIRDIMDATGTRRNIFVDSLELQKLTLQQVIHIRSYEIDLATTIQWLTDLFSVLVKSHLHVGSRISELQHQKDDLQSFLDTAKEIYGYGCHLLEASFTLRQSSKLSVEPSETFGANLKNCWKRLQDISQEQLTRLRVSTVFHRSVDDYYAKLQDLRRAVCTAEGQEDVLQSQLSHRERLLVEVGRTVRLGRLLKTRLKEPLLGDEGQPRNEGMSDSNDSVVLEPDNSAASEAINVKLNRVTQMAESLDTVLKDVGVLCDNDSLGLQNVEEHQDGVKSQTEESVTRSSSDHESATTAPMSRSSSYHTASECRSSPWWDSEKNSDLDAEVEVTPGRRRSRMGMSSASTSFDDSDYSLMSTTFRSPIDSMESNKLRVRTPSTEEDPQEEEEDGDTSSSTISQQSSRKSSVMPDEVETVPEISSGHPSSTLIETAKKVSADDSRQPDFMAWNRYYQSLINKQTLRSCL